MSRSTVDGRQPSLLHSTLGLMIPQQVSAVLLRCSARLSATLTLAFLSAHTLLEWHSSYTSDVYTPDAHTPHTLLPYQDATFDLYKGPISTNEPCL